MGEKKKRVGGKWGGGNGEGEGEGVREQEGNEEEDGDGKERKEIERERERRAERRGVALKEKKEKDGADGKDGRKEKRKRNINYTCVSLLHWKDNFFPLPFLYHLRSLFRPSPFCDLVPGSLSIYGSLQILRNQRLTSWIPAL